MQKHFTWTKEEVISAFLAGETLNSLSRKFGGNYRTIRRILETTLGKDKFQAVLDKNNPNYGNWTREEVVAAFLAGEPLITLCKRLGGSPNTIRRVLKEQLGEKEFETVRDRNDPKQSTVSEEEVLAAFHTDEPMQKVATRFTTSINTLRDKWVAAFGREAFDARSKKFHSAAGTRAGSSRKGKKLISAETLQARDVARGVDRRCPVCNVGCVGDQALKNHMSRFGDEAHKASLESLFKQEEDNKWKHLKEGMDYVTCAVCGFRGESLSNHIKLHGLDSETYQVRYHDPIRSEALYKKRSEVMGAAQARNLFSKEDLLKYADADGKVVIASVAIDSGHVGATILGYCHKYGLPTRNRLAWQKAVLDKVALLLHSDYVWEWSDPRLVNTKTGRRFNYDGFFPKHNLIVESHGQQHYQYSELWHGVIEEFETQRGLDISKERRAIELGYNYKIVRFTDPIKNDTFWTDLLSGNKNLWVNKTEEEKSAIVEATFQIIRNQGWIEPEPSSQTKAELTRLQNTKVYLEGDLLRPYSIVGAYVAGTLFPNRYYAKRRDGLNAWELWHDDESLRKAIRLQLDKGDPITLENIIKVVVMFSRIPSVFRPVTAKYVYENYCPKGGVVWDPCAGYGGRLIAAIASKVGMYLGTDIEPTTVRGNTDLANFLGAKSRCRMAVIDAITFEPNEKLDLIFTTLPCSIENQDVNSWQFWTNDFLKPLIQRSFGFLNSKGHLVFHLPWKSVEKLHLDQMANSIASSVGFKQLPTILMSVRSVDGNKREPLLVWQKV